jgi:2-dehydropantoate 2-reductase
MIYIIGAGAIGKSLAVFLKLAQRQVVIIRGSVDDGSMRTEHIRIETASGAVYEADVEIATLSNFGRLEGVVVLANKSYGNELLATALKPKISSSPIILLQNGLGVERPFMTNYFMQVYRCVLFVTCQLIGESHIRFKPVATCPVGIERGNPMALKEIVNMLNTSQFAFECQEEIQDTIWKKAIVNCVFNSVCPLLEVDNGIFHRNSEALKMAVTVISECAAIARHKGILIEEDEVMQTLFSISKSSDGQLISTFQDIINKRPTEIDTLNFEIVRIAEGINKGGMVEKTRLLGELTQLKAAIKLNTLG